MSSNHIFSLAAGLLFATACAGAADDGQSNSDSQAEELAKKKPAASSCKARGAACEVGKGAACCAGTACVEYTKYDYPRCRPTLANGHACTANAECRSGTCNDGTCEAAPACLPANDACEVGKDTCCVGTCVKYTEFDFPRCRTAK